MLCLQNQKCLASSAKTMSKSSKMLRVCVAEHSNTSSGQMGSRGTPQMPKAPRSDRQSSSLGAGRSKTMSNLSSLPFRWLAKAFDDFRTYPRPRSLVRTFPASLSKNSGE